MFFLIVINLNFLLLSFLKLSARKEILEYETKLKSLNDKVSKITKELADNEKKYQLDIEKVTLEVNLKKKGFSFLIEQFV